MKTNFLWTIIFIFLSNPLIAQENNILRGKILYLNSGKMPAAGVEISGIIKGSEHTNLDYSTPQGAYRLVFPKARTGHSVKLKIGNRDQTGQEIELVNEREVAICRIPAHASDEFEIIVCPKGARDLAAQRYYRIIKTSADRELTKKQRELDRLIVQKKKDYKLIGELSEKISRLEQQSDSISIYKEAFRIASINKDNATKRMLRYIQLLDEGKSVREAREVLSINKATREGLQGIVDFNASIRELERRAGSSISIFDFEDAITCYDSIIFLMEKVDINPVRLAEMFHHKGTIYHEEGNYEEARQLHEKAIGILERSDPEHPDLPELLTHLSVTYWGLSQLDTSMILQERALEILQAIENPDVIDLAMTYSSLGRSLELKGEFEQALSYQHKAIDTLKQKDSLDYSSLATLYGDIALTYQSMGKFSEAISYQESALEMLYKIHSIDHPFVATGLSELGLTLYYDEQFDSALVYQLKAKAIIEEKLNSKHSDLATIYNDIGLTYDKLGKHEEALELQQRAIAIGEAVMDSNHIFLSIYYANIGITYNSLNQLQSSVDYHLKSIKIKETNVKNEVLSPDSPYLGIGYLNLSNTYYKMLRFDESLHYMEKSLRILRKTTPPDHPYRQKAFIGWLDIYSEKAYDAFLKGDYAAARADFDTVLTYADSNYASLATIWTNFGWCNLYLNDFDKARIAFAEYEKLAPLEGRSYRNWAAYYALKNDKEKAIEYLEKAIELGYDDIDWLENDESIKKLRRTKAYKNLLKGLKEKKEEE